MFQIRCTRKMQAILGVGKDGLGEVKGPETALGNWYANVFTVDRRKTFIFMNERTLLSFVIYGVKKSNATFLPEMFLNGLVRLLRLEQFNGEAINRIVGGYQEIELTGISDKKKLGNLVDLMKDYEIMIMRGGGLKFCDMDGIIRKLNRMPQRNLGWKYSIEAARSLLGEQPQQCTEE